MSWNAYQLVYQAMSPVHVGWHTLGYIKLTRYYIPGKAMWGAFVANMAKSGQGCFGYEDYGKLFRQAVLPSYFFPAIDDGDGLHPIFPQYTCNGFKYCRYGKDETEAGAFENRSISSLGQTAIFTESNTAENESLHESEFITPIVKLGDEFRQVYFIGYLFIQRDAHMPDGKTEVGWEGKTIVLKECLSEIFIGGDRKYGWGRLLLDSEQDKTADRKMFNTDLNPDKDFPEVTVPRDYPVLSHVRVQAFMKIKGDIEPLVSREWGVVVNKDQENMVGFGQKVQCDGLFWMPGSVLEQPDNFKIGPYGIWDKG